MDQVQQIHRHLIIGGGNLKLYVEETGKPDGIPLLFIHGFNQCGLVWSKQVNSSLADEFRIVTFDLRGHGLSEKPHDAYSDSKLWADDIHAIIEQLGLDRPVLIGWSYGGMVICDYLRYYGEEAIRGINLVNARSRIGTPEAIAETGKDYLPLRPGLFSDNITEGITAITTFVKLCTFKEPSPSDLYFFLGFNAIVPPHVRQGMMSRSLDNAALLTTLKKPVLITHGLQDQIVNLTHAKHNAQHIKNAATSFYEEVGHNPFWENAPRFNHELRQFVKFAMP